jgi:hypothetical protein
VVNLIVFISCWSTISDVLLIHCFYITMDKPIVQPTDWLERLTYIWQAVVRTAVGALIVSAEDLWCPSVTKCECWRSRLKQAAITVSGILSCSPYMVILSLLSILNNLWNWYSVLSIIKRHKRMTWIQCRGICKKVQAIKCSKQDRWIYWVEVFAFFKWKVYNFFRYIYNI